MTREDVLKLFPEATDEQITNLLNQNNSEVAREKTKAGQYKAKADSADELQKKLDSKIVQLILRAGQMRIVMQWYVVSAKIGRASCRERV